MKWFSNKTISSFPGERAKQFVGYLGRSGELPERDSILSALFETIREHMDEIEDGTYAEILCLGSTYINHWISMFGTETIIDEVITHKHLEQTMIANLLQNPNLTNQHLTVLSGLTDRSNRGIMNSRIIREKVGDS